MVQISVDDLLSERSPGRLLHQISRHMLLFAEEHFAGAELTFNQWLTVRSVHDGSVGTAGDVARLLRMTTGAATRLIDGLEIRQLLKRERCRDDRRIVRLAATPEGIDRVVGMAPILTDAWNGILSDFDEDEFAEFMRSATKLLTAFEQFKGARRAGAATRKAALRRAGTKRSSLARTAPTHARGI